MPDVNTGLVDFALHPPFGLLKPHLDATGPHGGNVTLTQWSSTLGPIYTLQPVSNTFGVLLQVASVLPAAFGYAIGWQDPLGNSEDVFDVRLAQLVVQHQLLSGAWITTQIADVHSFSYLLMWDVALPGRLGILAAPGVDFDLYYLLVN